VAGELVTGPGLIQWGPLLLGRRQASGTLTPYRWREISGWEETPALDSGNVDRAQAHGAYPGQLLAQARILTLEGLMVRVPAGQIGAAVAAFNRATPVAQAEQPLVVWVDERGPLLVNARLRRRFLPVDGRWALGHSGGGAIQWEATDPRRYQLTQQVALTGLPSSESGLSWGSPSETGLAWGTPTETGLIWGSAGSTGDLTCSNAGDADTHPTIEIRGPVTTPSITVLGTSLILEYGLTLAAGETLTIDCWAGTGTLGGQDRLASATARSVPEGLLVLPANSTATLSFRSTDGVPDPAASATIRWRSAYW
jgi:hypothetical protein